MAKFEPGETAAVPATVQDGAFPGEYLVTVQTNTGEVSGFVRERDFVTPQKTIRAVVRPESNLSILVLQVAGSYFTTNGFMEFAADWADKNIKAIA